MAADDSFVAEVPKEVVEHEDFVKGADETDGSLLTRIESAVSTIKCDGVIPNAKSLGDGLYERKWKNGLRMFFAVVEIGDRERKQQTLLILGSGKDRGQQKAIDRSKENLKRYSVFLGSIKLGDRKEEKNELSAKKDPKRN